MINTKRLGLGTVQLGLDYGITNKDGQVALSAAHNILHHAQCAGISVLDTAAAYGNAEEVIGHLLQNLQNEAANHFRIITKTALIRKNQITAQDLQVIADRFSTSLQHLQTNKVDTLMVHHADDLLVAGGDSLYAYLTDLKQSGIIRNIGVSIYDRAQLDTLADRYDIDVIQLPINIFDQRLRQDGTLTMLKQAGIEIHARSVFLQGLLLMETNELPSHLKALEPTHRSFTEMHEEKGCSALSACLSFIMDQPEIDIALVGVLNAAQLRDIVTAAKIDSSPYERYSISETSLIDPRLWPS